MTRVGALSLLLALALPAAAQELVTIPTRPEVTQSFFIAAMGSVKPEAVAVLYAGGDGEIRLRMQRGEAKFKEGNFLVRSRRDFIRNAVLPVLVDVPSDSPSGLSDAYRRSDAQAADARAVLAELRKRFPRLPLYIVTTSRGTLSGAHLARVLGPDEAAGIVLSSSMAAPGRGWEVVGSLDPREVKVRLLFVHHRDDGCQATPYAAAARLADGFPLVSVRGGYPAKSSPCEAFAPHGYFGKEAQTVDAIAAWILKKPFAREIE